MKRIFIDSINQWAGDGVLSIIGATGSGKTHKALTWVREHLGDPNKALLVSVDSVAAYRGLDIGSAKPEPALRSEFRWAGLDLFDPSEKATAADYLRHTRPLITEALENNERVILVGGSHFYEKALVDGQRPGAASDPDFQSELSKLPEAELFLRLVQKDPRFKSKIHPNDRYRLSRALDLSERQGISYEELYSETGSRLHPKWSCTYTLLRGADDILKDALEARIQEMFERGWVQEVKDLLAQGAKASWPGLQSVGYLEIVDFLEGRLSETELRPLILTRHLQLAKKQRTWLRGMQKKAADSMR